jgi:hypothetical protein
MKEMEMATRYLTSSRPAQLLASEGELRIRESQRRRTERRLRAYSDSGFPFGLAGWGAATGGAVLVAAYLFVLPLVVELMRLLAR